MFWLFSPLLGWACLSPSLIDSTVQLHNTSSSWQTLHATLHSRQLLLWNVTNTSNPDTAPRREVFCLMNCKISSKSGEGKTGRDWGIFKRRVSPVSWTRWDRRTQNTFPLRFLFLSSSLSLPPQPPDTSFRGPASLPSLPLCLPCSCWSPSRKCWGIWQKLTVAKQGYSLYTTGEKSRNTSQIHWCKTFTISN